MTTMSETLDSFGSLLNVFRKRRHLTQKQLAAVVGVHRNAIGRWEQGDFLPANKAIVLELARHLHLNDQETRSLLEASLTALTPHWLVPVARNPFFTGREEILETLHRQLSIDQTIALTQSSALHGLGGVGKTQIALEYAYRYALEYSAVFWISAETDEQIVSSLLRIAEVLHLPERDSKDQQRVIEVVQRWLNTHYQWLLIWDNVEDLAVLDRFLPPSRQGAILITTRCHAVGILAVGIDLLPMKQEEGVQLLLRRAKVLSPEATSRQMQQFVEQETTQYAAATELVSILGGLPLALDQAGAYIEETGCSLSGYLQRYEQQQSRLLDRRGALSDHPHSVVVTFRLSLERLEREQGAAMDMLRVCALLHADAIPEELFMEGAVHLGPELAALADDPLQFDHIIVFLRSLSLVQRQAEARTLSLHRLVQAVLKEHMSEEVRHLWKVRVLRVLSQFFPSSEKVQADYWQSCERLLPHALVFLMSSEGEDEKILSISLLSHVATYLSERSRYTEAETFFQRAIRMGEQMLGADHSQTVEALYGLALHSWRQGKNTEAVFLFQKVIRLKEQTPSADHPQMDEALYGLASLYRNQGKYAEAEPLFQRAICLGEQTLGVDHPQVATSLQGLAVLYAEQWKHAKAEPLYQRALHIREQTLGADHPQVAVVFNNLAEDYREQGRYEEAASLFQRALHIWEQALGSEHPRIAHPLNGLAEVAREQGRYEEATSLFQRALHIWEQALGSEHPRIAEALNGLAEVALAQGQDEQAEALYQRALHIWQQTFGPEHSAVAYPLTGLANLSLKQGKDAQAETLFQRVLSIREQHLGQHHPETAQTLHDLSVFHQKQGNLSDALSFAERALSIRLQSLGDAHPKTVATRALAIQLLQEQASMQEKTDAQRPTETISAPYRKEGHEKKAVPSLHKGGNSSVSELDPLQEFLVICCELHPQAWCRISDLWQAYEHWVAEQQERFPLSRRAFTAQVKMRGCRTDRTSMARIWRGIALKNKTYDRK